MAGLPGAVSATLNDKVLTFLNRAKKVVLEPLPFSDVDAFYLNAFKKLGLDVPGELRREASIAVQGSPYLLQLIGHNVSLYAGSEKTIDDATMSEAIKSAQTDYENDVCKTTLSALSDKDRAFLTAMAKVGTPAKMSEVALAMGESQDYAQKYRRRLIDAGVIESPERGKVDFAVPYLEKYLEQDI